MQLTIAIEKREKNTKYVTRRKLVIETSISQASSCNYEQALCSIEGIRKSEEEKEKNEEQVHGRVLNRLGIYRLELQFLVRSGRGSPSAVSATVQTQSAGTKADRSFPTLEALVRRWHFQLFIVAGIHPSNSSGTSPNRNEQNALLFPVKEKPVG